MGLRMSIGREVKAYATMRTISTPPLLRRLVDLDVLDDQVAGVEALGVSVGFGVLEQAEQELGGLFGPAGFGNAELFSCGGIFVSGLCVSLLCGLLEKREP